MLQVGMRTVGGIFIISGIISDDPSGMSGWCESDEDENDNKGNGAAKICIGGIIYLLSEIHDFRTLGKAVEQYNRKHTGTTISVNPTYFTSQNAPGIAVSVSF